MQMVIGGQCNKNIPFQHHDKRDAVHQPPFLVHSFPEKLHTLLVKCIRQRNDSDVRIVFQRIQKQNSGFAKPQPRQRIPGLQQNRPSSDQDRFVRFNLIRKFQRFVMKPIFFGRQRNGV